MPNFVLQIRTYRFCDPKGEPKQPIIVNLTAKSRSEAQQQALSICAQRYAENRKDPKFYRLDGSLRHNDKEIWHFRPGEQLTA